MKNYLKKFSIMFVMLLAVIGFGAIHNGTVANAATIGQQLTSPESGWKRYDDTSSNIKYSSDFVYTTIYSLFLNGDDHYTENTNGATGTIKFSFYGTKIRLLDNIYTNRNRNSKISFDGGKTFESCSAYGANTYGALRLYYEKTGLEKAIHNVVIQVPIDSGKCFIFDCFDIDNDGYVLGDESISLNQSSMPLTVGASEQLIAVTTPASVGVTWTSSDHSIATVDSTGKVTGVKEGQATITATTADGLTSTCVVNVANKTIPVEPTPTESEYIVNTARAKGNNTNNASGGVSIIYKGVAEAQLSVVKTADVQSVFVGDNFTYTLVVTNTSSQIAKAVVINDNAPNHIQFTVSGVTTTQGKVDPSSTSKNIIVNVGDIPPSGTVTIKIPVTVIL